MATAKFSGEKAAHRAGFTLIELLTVMSVMVIITTLVIASGFGYRRSASYSAASELPVRVLEYAHQRACMDGRDTAVRFAPDASGTYHASIFQTIGHISGISQTSISDKYSDLTPNGVNGTYLTVFSFDNGGYFSVGDISKVENQLTFSSTAPDFSANGEGNLYYYSEIELKTIDRANFSNFSENDRYGFEVSDRVIMPENFTYSCSGPHTDGDSFWIVFTADGAGDDATIEIGENVPNSKFHFTITVTKGNVKTGKS